MGLRNLKEGIMVDFVLKLVCVYVYACVRVCVCVKHKGQRTTMLLYPVLTRSSRPGAGLAAS